MTLRSTAKKSIAKRTLSDGSTRWRIPGGYRLRRVRAQQDVDIRLAGKHKAKAALTDPKHSPRSVTDAV